MERLKSLPLIGGPADGKRVAGIHAGIIYVRLVGGGLVIHRDPREDAAPYRLVLSADAAHYEHEE